MEADLREKARSEVLKAMSDWTIRDMEWGVDDCMLSVANILVHLIGVDPASEVRGRYKTRLGAYRILGRGGTLQMAKSTAKSLGWRQIRPETAMPGDVGLISKLVKNRRGDVEVMAVAVVCRDAGWFVARAKRGFVAFPSGRVSHAWSID